MDYMTLYIVMAALFGLFMAWGIGANDVANAMATSIGSRVLTVKGAIIVAAIFEFSGAVLAGGEVTSTIRKGIIDVSTLTDPVMMVHGMLGSLLAAGIWLYVASRQGWPVSTTHSIVGAIIGFGIAAMGVEAVKWSEVGNIVASWVASPLTAGVVAFLLFTSVQRLVLERSNPLAAARRWVPMYMFLAGFFVSLVTMLKGLKHVGLEISSEEAYLIAAILGAVISGIGIFFIRRIPTPDTHELEFKSVERVFAVLMVLTACAMAFAHGSNDVANAIGPVAAVLSTLKTGAVGQSAPLPLWVLLLGGGGIVLGLATYGVKVIETVGRNITHLTPSRGFAAELSAAGTVVVASGLGMPISTTHTLVGAVLGVGLARGIAAINLGIVRTIFMSWIVTLPAGAILSIMFFSTFQMLLG